MFENKNEVLGEKVKDVLSRTSEKYPLLNRTISEVVYYSDGESWPKYKEGSLLESAVLEAVRELQISREMAITSALGAMSLSAQGIINVEEPTGNIVNASLMLLTIAESGERKTTTEKKFFESLRAFQREQYEKARQDFLAYEQKVLVWKDKCSALRNKLKLSIKKGEPEKSIEAVEVELNALLQKHPVPYGMHKFIYEDATPQALVTMMHRSSRNACLLSSEGNGIFNGKVFGQLHLLNALWDGGEVVVDRVSTDSFHMYDARLTLALMAQNTVVKEFMDKRGEKARGMGFLARFLAVKATEKAGKRANKDLGPLPHLKAFNRRSRELIEESWEREKQGRKREEIGFTADAGELWREMAQAIEVEMQPYRVYEFYKDHASKLMDNISRMAGLIQYFENRHCGKSEQIDLETLSFAYSLGMKYSKHFLKHLAGEPEIIENANKLVRFLLSKAAKDRKLELNDLKQNQLNQRRNYNEESPLPETLELRQVRYIDGIKYLEGLNYDFTVSDVHSYGPTALRKGPDGYAKLNAVIDILVKLGHIFVDDGGANITYRFYEVPPHDNPLKNLYQRHNINKQPLEPEFKNGYEYSIFSLPMYDDLRVVSFPAEYDEATNMQKSPARPSVRVMPVPSLASH
ncbi:MAG: YfjI family protein [Hydrogenovibrio sp.]|uniref:YfjI family protein n=1 Tax=Hydrogenovibrio sp. TaxID=2065821 RepID=UPI0028702BF5|nr:YfjI family protein [Hydrogenovibrio sp.]MDR9498893.1 YfjI family protein [Hydrogenovibrio sp.]